MTEARRFFGPWGRHYDEFGVRHKAGSEPTLREDLAYLLTDGRLAEGEYMWLGDAAQLLGRPRAHVRAASDDLEAHGGYVQLGRDASGRYLLGPTRAALAERNRCMCVLYPIMFPGKSRTGPPSPDLANLWGA